MAGPGRVGAQGGAGSGPDSPSQLAGAIDSI
jgi:hypothetical protein